MYRKPQSGVHLCLLAARTLTLRSGTMAAAAVPSLSSAAQLQWKDISLSMLLRAADWEQIRLERGRQITLESPASGTARLSKRGEEEA